MLPLAFSTPRVFLTASLKVRKDDLMGTKEMIDGIIDENNGREEITVISGCGT